LLRVRVVSGGGGGGGGSGEEKGRGILVASATPSFEPSSTGALTAASASSPAAVPSMCLERYQLQFAGRVCVFRLVSASCVYVFHQHLASTVSLCSSLFVDLKREILTRTSAWL
jgi:hypothetical protein